MNERKAKMYRCNCGFVTGDFNQFLDHFAEHMQFELLHDKLMKELEREGRQE